MNLNGRKSSPSLGLMQYGLHKDLPSESDTDDEDYVPADQEKEFSALKDKQRKRKMKTKSTSLRKPQKKCRRFGDLLSSDDSDDSDYIPPGAQEEHTKKKVYLKKSKASSIKHVKPTSTPSLKIGDSKSLSSNLWSGLPLEVLAKIFVNVARSHVEGTKCVIRCSQVCKWWNFVVSQPVSWEYVDFSFLGGTNTDIDKVLTALSEQRFKNVRVLLLNGCRKLTDVGLTQIARFCLNLEVLDISHCQKKSISKISNKSIIPIALNCSLLKNINLSNTRLSKYYVKTLNEFFEICGKNLTHINVSGVLAFDSTLLNKIIEKCKSLQVIDISNTSVRKICFQTFQSNCEKLEELYMANLPLEPKLVFEKTMPGFPELKICSLAASKYFWVTDFLIKSILKSSLHLKLVDLRGSEIMTDNVFDIPAKNVERLYLSRCCIPRSTFQKIFSKWHSSLRELDLSWIVIFGLPFDLAVTSIETTYWTNIEYVNIAGTPITDEGVKHILKTAKNIKLIDLTSCRGVSRGLKRLHNGLSEISFLKKKLFKKRYFNM